MVAADGKNDGNNLIITAEQVTTAANNMLQAKKWTRVYKRDQEKIKAGRGRSHQSSAQEVSGNIGGSPMKVTPIETCLRSDSSLLQEIQADKTRTTCMASAFLKK